MNDGSWFEVKDVIMLNDGLMQIRIYRKEPAQSYNVNIDPLIFFTKFDKALDKKLLEREQIYD